MLECGKISRNECRWNGTCVYEREICNRSISNLFGGIYCSALIEISNENFDEIQIKSFGCMYDQEATKSCTNQSKCTFKYTNKQMKFLHCCCDQDSCNHRFDL